MDLALRRTASTRSVAAGRARALVAGVLVSGVAGLVGYAALAQGAFYWSQARFFASALAVLGTLAAARAARGAWPTFVALGGLASGLGASAAVNGWNPDAAGQVASLIAALGAFLVVRALVRSGQRSRYLEVLTWTGAAVALVGLVSLAYHFYPWAMRAQGIWRLSSTISYANAAAMFLLLALPAPLLLLRERRSPAIAVSAFLIATGAVATLSRGGAVAAIVMLAIVVVMGGRAMLRASGRVAAGTVVAVAALWPSISGAEGRPMLALAGLVAGAIISTPGVRRRRILSMRTALLVALLAPLVVTLFLSEGSGRIIEARLGAGSEDRLRTWNAVWGDAVERPWFGSGPGSFRVAESVDGKIEITLFAHNEYLQAFTETGIVGLVAIGGAIVLLAGWAWRSRPQRGTGERAVWAVAAGACAAFAVHGAFDFVWHLPLLVALAFGWLAIASTTPERPVARAATGATRAWRRPAVPVGLLIGALLAVGVAPAQLGMVGMRMSSPVGEYSYPISGRYPVRIEPFSIRVREGGPEVRYRVRLLARPNARVIVTPRADDRLDVWPRQRVFTPQDWRQPRFFSVTARDDHRYQGRRWMPIRHRVLSRDTAFGRFHGPEVWVGLRDRRCIEDSLPQHPPVHLPCRGPIPLPGPLSADVTTLRATARTTAVDGSADREPQGTATAPPEPQTHEPDPQPTAEPADPLPLPPVIDDIVRLGRR